MTVYKIDNFASNNEQNNTPLRPTQREVNRETKSQIIINITKNNLDEFKSQFIKSWLYDEWWLKVLWDKTLTKMLKNYYLEFYEQWYNSWEKFSFTTPWKADLTLTMWDIKIIRENIKRTSRKFK